MVDLSEIQAAYYMVAATGVLVAAVFYVLNMRISQKNQELSLKAQQQTLETRQAQMFMNIYDKNSSIEFSKAWEKVVFTPWSTFEEYSKLWEDPEFNDAAMLVVNTYEGIGVLVKEGLLDIKFIALLMSGKVRGYFEKINPILDDGRRSMGYSRWASETEYLYDELMRYLQKHPELDALLVHAPHTHALYEK
jgi:hypothetical protein